MNWQSIYIDDFNTQEKRQVRQIVLHECELSTGSFYRYLHGKETRRIISQRIESIIIKYRNERSTSYN